MYTGEFATKIFRKIEWFTVYIFSNQKNAAAKAHLKQTSVDRSLADHGFPLHLSTATGAP
jgi:hypothetical protein